MAAERGDADAQYNWDLMYAEGQGVSQDCGEAARWYHTAEQGDASAQYSIGLMYAEGRGVPQDLMLACKWYYVAALQGHEDAQTAMGKVSGSMTEDQVAHAQWLARGST